MAINEQHKQKTASIQVTSKEMDAIEADVAAWKAAVENRKTKTVFSKQLCEKFKLGDSKDCPSCPVIKVFGTGQCHEIKEAEQLRVSKMSAGRIKELLSSTAAHDGWRGMTAFMGEQREYPRKLSGYTVYTNYVRAEKIRRACYVYKDDPPSQSFADTIIGYPGDDCYDLYVRTCIHWLRQAHSRAKRWNTQKQRISALGWEPGQLYCYDPLGSTSFGRGSLQWVRQLSSGHLDIKTWSAAAFAYKLTVVRKTSTYFIVGEDAEGNFELRAVFRTKYSAWNAKVINEGEVK